jgi:hypothetical protein
MKVRLTVCGDGGRLEDVEVDAPTGSMWREVLAELHAVGWSGELAIFKARRSTIAVTERSETGRCGRSHWTRSSACLL